MMDRMLVYALAAAVLGGLDSPLGAVVAAWIIGVSENLAGPLHRPHRHDLRIAVPLLLLGWSCCSARRACSAGGRWCGV